MLGNAEKQGLTPSLNICLSHNQSILQPLQEASTFMGFAQSDGLTGCYRFMPQTQMSIPPLSSCVTKKKKIKKSSSLITAVCEQVALSQRATTIGNTGWYASRNVRQAVHGPVGHLSATDNSFWRRIFTDLWLPLRTMHTHAWAQRRTLTRRVRSSWDAFMRLLRKTVEKKSIKSVFGDERSIEGG